jgi:hypothetical protein
MSRISCGASLVVGEALDLGFETGEKHDEGGC